MDRVLLFQVIFYAFGYIFNNNPTDAQYDEVTFTDKNIHICRYVYEIPTADIYLHGVLYSVPDLLIYLLIYIYN